MKTTRLKPPRRVIIRGRTFWQVTTPAPEGGRIRKTFRSRDDARIHFERAKVAVHQFGTASMALDEKERGDAVRALALLKPYGATLLDAAKDFAARAAAREGGKPLAEAVNAFLAAQERRGMAPRYIGDLRPRLARFLAAHPEASTASITTGAINDYLDGLALHPTTRNNVRRILAVFFSWCQSARLCQSNPAKDSDIAKAPARTPGVLTPQQFAAMLESAEAIIRPAVALAGFCGLRQAEIARLDWRDVDLAERVVILDAGTTKTASRRTVQVPLAALDWLAPLAKPSGPVMVAGIESRAAWDLCRMVAGFGPFETGSPEVREATAALSASDRKALRPWPSNALRHSAISFRLALSPEDAAAAYGIAAEAAHSITGIESVAFAAGNSPQVIKAHYLRLSKPTQARSWFGVKPAAAAANVIRLRKRA